MNPNRFKLGVLFGGCGFVGSHFAKHLLANDLADRVVLADLQPPRKADWPPDWEKQFDDGRLRYVPADVRQPITHSDLAGPADLVVNLAAVHREPGHEPHEYFATNLPGAENVCAWAERVGCRQMIFTSSIAPYGPTEDAKGEDSLPVPVSAYGSSKLAAEKMHIGWQRAGKDRRLLIVRPGVIFGPGEGGNVTRLVQAVLHRRFCYMGNRATRKAGGYVKELCRVITWMLDRQAASDENMVLCNFTMDPAPTVEEYVRAVCREAGVKRFVPSVPYAALLGVSYGVDGLARLLRINQPISPVRIRKLVRSNNIIPGILRRAGYQYQYTLDAAMADWHRERPDEWR